MLMLVGAAALAEVPVAAGVVREEALRLQLDPAGRPLPLVAHWHRMSLPLSVQVQLIRDGHPFLPWMDYSRTMGGHLGKRYSCPRDPPGMEPAIDPDHRRAVGGRLLSGQ